MFDDFEKQRPSEDFSEIKKILNLPESATTRDIYFAFLEKDQEVMRNWSEADYTDPGLEINKVKKALEVYENDSPEKLDEGMRELLWMWYHHASQKVFQKGDKEVAIQYIQKALEYINNGNKISRLLLYLYNKEYEEAEKYISTIESEVEKQTAIELLEDFKKHYA